MKYLRQIFLTLLTLLCFQQIKCYGQVDSLTIIPDQAILNEGLNYYMSKIPNGKEKSYGLNSKDEYTKIHVGDPLFIITTPADISENKKGKLRFKTIDEWFIPLLVDNECKLMLRYKRKNTAQNVVGIGYSILAENLRCCNAFDNTNYKKDGILLIPELKAMFLVKRIKDEFFFYPLGLTTKFFSTGEKEYLSYDDLNKLLTKINYLTIN